MRKSRRDVIIAYHSHITVSLLGLGGVQAAGWGRLCNWHDVRISAHHFPHLKRRMGGSEAERLFPLVPYSFRLRHLIDDPAWA